ncbi:MAG: bifunctional diguanylate cyclase/phosphodiesterase [Candidatus Dactylopiibacterium carminicum]|uniref:Bifunctional diguanylate cyclase/phosphodiesterase n=1 Tax=Candidatus Dactylopiibacterium carminicum TaxID=857335 RepID=A0A272EUP9_9RHOO|nr:EAL domain-containing protein [Candidatus Dactylopiibacterium carminicum]KAF7600343.1 bifunctional diguanylate cyclase/phosphodiesterase [Candidatus Dactylopiibacterium carminicum]PAS93829.1 MAG: bifunctional diguanylate cyclase/phosphodiesterase [Candidatus Dactylopiibacterium carminicum]PAS95623.1 MAG: bifunctional diguanylate cyclase/phosphodiesterase [Candidatus Dactylopiibacterium carminicum]PAT00344.1 MAG: hypothetical protein BSR46_02920 [Candidatus Dactylopiibacterium carminicum]
MRPGLPRSGLALVIGVVGILVIGLMAWSHVSWDRAIQTSLVQLDSLNQSRAAVASAELLLERAVSSPTTANPEQLAGDLARALVFVRGMRSGEGTLAGMQGRQPFAALDAALQRYEQSLLDAGRQVQSRLRVPETVSPLDLRPQYAQVDAAAQAVEALLLRELSGLRQQQRMLDGLNILGAGLLYLVCIALLGLFQARNEAAYVSLVHSEAQLRAFAEAVPGMSFLLDRSGRYDGVYGSDDTLFGAPKESLLGRRLHDVLPLHLAERSVRLIVDALDSNEPRQIEYSLPVHGGLQHHFEGRICPLGDGSHVVWVSWDVSARWQAEQRVHVLKRLYEFLSNVNQAIVWSRDRDLLFSTICRTAVSIGGFGLAWVSWRNKGATGLDMVVRAGGEEIADETLGEVLKLEGGGPGSQVFFGGDVLLLDRLEPAGMPSWCTQALAGGLPAYAGIPLRDQNVVVGVLNLLGEEIDPQDAEELALLREVGIDISYAVTLFSREAQQREVEGCMRLFAAALESCQDGVMITDLDAQILYINRAFTRITGYEEADSVGQTPALLNSGRHSKAFYAEMWHQLKRVGAWQGEVWNRRKDGGLYAQWMSISTVQDLAGSTEHFVAVFTDITHLKETEEQLKHLAHFDPLTDLPNRMFLNAHLTHALELAKRQGQYLAVLFIDLDNFKHINDALGHAAGDELLIAVARRLGARLRRQDSLGRLGGDEFLLILEALNVPQDAALVAVDLLSALDEAVVLQSGHMLYVRVSIGISVYPDDGTDAAELIRQTDAAMYQAKRAGRSTYRFYTEALTAAANYRLELEARLRQAFDNDEFSLHFQPLINMADNSLLGAEVLVRLQPPGVEPISPATFIPLLEETGLIVKLGDWVTRKTCEQGRRWLDEGMNFGSLAINVSPLEIRRGEYAGRLRRVLKETGFPAEMLEIELTESGLMEQGPHSRGFLEELRAMGVRLSIDDFGTGYSSLAYLRHMPVDKLKIDRRFITEIPANLADAKLAATIIAMARSLNIKVLAEGVETESQLAFLKEQGCDACQGYLFSPPLSAADFVLRYLTNSLPKSEPAQ